MRSRVLQLDSRDNVLVALADLKRTENVEWEGRQHVLQSDVPAKHKFATTDLASGDRVVMYGVLVGQAVKPIAAGELLTVSNIRHQAASVSSTIGAVPLVASRAFRSGVIQRLRVIHDLTGKSAHAITGWLCPWSFAKTRTFRC